MKHISIIPDCPKCGSEMKIITRGNPPYDNDNPWGSTFTAWYKCEECNYTSDEYTAKHRPEAITLAEEGCGKKDYVE